MDNRKGIMLVIASMAGFTIEDMFIKQLSTDIPISQILLILGGSGALIFAVMARRKGRNVFAADVWSKAALARATAEAVAALTFITSLALIPISTVAAVFQATPLAITMGAALFLGEQVGWRRWAAIFVGFIGVLMIIRPGLSSFDPRVLLVLVTVLTIAARDLTTRLIDDSISSTVVSFQGFTAVFVSGALLYFAKSTPLVAVSPLQAAYFTGAVLFGVISYYAIVAAMRIGDASAITPFRYTRLLFSLIVGVVIFDESPDALTLIGAATIIATGLYMFLRERRVEQGA